MPYVDRRYENPTPRRREQLHAANRRYYTKNREVLRAKYRVYYETHKEADRFKHIRRKYGLTRDEYMALLEAQGSVCAICHASHESGEPLYVDHDHVTGKVRGLLCMLCNGGLGCFNDRTDIMEAAMSYIEKWRPKRGGPE